MMTDTTVAAPPLDDIWATKRPELLIGGGSKFAWSPQAKPLSGPHGRLRAAVFLYMAMQLFLMLVISGSLYLFWMIQIGGDFETPMVGMLVTFVGLAGDYAQPVAIVVTLISLVTYLMFVYRAMSNLHLSNARNLTITPGWSVGWSFIPFANLGMVFNVMRQIWIVSHDPETGRHSPPFTIVLWWGCWIAGSIVGRISDAGLSAGLESAAPTEYLNLYSLPASLGILSGALGLTSCICLLVIIKQITSAQELLRSTAAFDE